MSAFAANWIIFGYHRIGTDLGNAIILVEGGVLGSVLAVLGHRVKPGQWKEISLAEGFNVRFHLGQYDDPQFEGDEPPRL